MRYLTILRGVMSVPLLMLLAACATQESIVVPPVHKCIHPTIDPTTNAGLVRGILMYHDSLDTCNAENGFSPVDGTQETR